jgi:hypothetical protein
MIHFILEREALSLNDPIYGVNKAGARYAYKNARSNIVNTLFGMLGRGNEQERTAWKITRNWGPRRSQFDDANLISGFKILIDAMVLNGYIQDDNPNFFKGYYFQQKSDKNFGYIEVQQLDARGEVKAAFEQMAESYKIDESTLLEIAKETELIREELETNEDN